MNRVRSLFLFAGLLGCQPLLAADGQIDLLLKTTGTAVISAPGSYVVVSSVVKTDSTDGIQINVSDVTLDMHGQSLRGGTGGTGIKVGSSASNVRIMNGSIVGFPNGGVLLSAGGTGGAGHVLSNMQITENGAYNLDISSNQTTVQVLATMSSQGDGIHISGNDVTVDLGGQSVRRIGAAGGTGIMLVGTPSRVRIRNGSVSNFAIGVDLLGSGHVVSQIQASENAASQINVGSSRTSIEAVGVSLTIANAADGIAISADDVTVDLNGQAIRGTGAGAGVGIKVTGTANRARITDGSVSNFGGGGILLGSGEGHHVSGMRVMDSGTYGIDVLANKSTIIDSESHGANGAAGANLRIMGSRNQVVRNSLTQTVNGAASVRIQGAAALSNFLDANTLGGTGTGNANLVCAGTTFAVGVSGQLGALAVNNVFGKEFLLKPFTPLPVVVNCASMSIPPSHPESCVYGAVTPYGAGAAQGSQDNVCDGTGLMQQ